MLRYTRFAVLVSGRDNEERHAYGMKLTARGRRTAQRCARRCRRLILAARLGAGQPSPGWAGARAIAAVVGAARGCSRWPGRRRRDAHRRADARDHFHLFTSRGRSAPVAVLVAAYSPRVVRSIEAPDRVPMMRRVMRARVAARAVCESSSPLRRARDVHRARAGPRENHRDHTDYNDASCAMAIPPAVWIAARTRLRGRVRGTRSTRETRE